MIPSDVAWVPVVDISRNQGAIDFKVMRRRGVLGLIMRVAHGMTADALVADYYRDALAAGYQADDIGFYSFLNPKRGSGPDTARFALEQIVKLRGDLDTFYMIDVENYKDETPDKGSAPVYDKAFADYIRQHLTTVEVESPETRRIGYTNKSYWNGRISTFSLKRWVGDNQLASEIDWIVARYPVYSPAGYAAKPLPESPREWDEWAFKVAPEGPFPPNGADGWRGWQMSAGFNGQGPGYGATSSDLDLNVIYPKSWIEWTRQAPMPPPNPPQGDDMPTKIWSIVGVPDVELIADTSRRCVWADPANSRYATLKNLLRAADPTVDEKISKGNLVFIRLDGPLPTGMDPDDFINGDEIRDAATPVIAVDQVARDRADFAISEHNGLEDRYERYLEMVITSAGGSPR